MSRPEPPGTTPTLKVRVYFPKSCPINPDHRCGGTQSADECNRERGQFSEAIPRGIVECAPAGVEIDTAGSRSPLSAAFLSQVERGKAVPSIVSLINIAKALETDIHYFVTPPAPTSLVRRADDPECIDIDSPIVYKRLDAVIRNQRIESPLIC